MTRLIFEDNYTCTIYLHLAHSHSWFPETASKSLILAQCLWNHNWHWEHSILSCCSEAGLSSITSAHFPHRYTLGSFGLERGPFDMTLDLSGGQGTSCFATAGAVISLQVYVWSVKLLSTTSLLASDPYISSSDKYVIQNLIKLF